MALLKLTLITVEYSVTFSSLVSLATFEALNTHTWLVAITVDSEHRTLPSQLEVLLDSISGHLCPDTLQAPQMQHVRKGTYQLNFAQPPYFLYA